MTLDAIYAQVPVAGLPGSGETATMHREVRDALDGKVGA